MILPRSLTVWLILIAAEILHGIVRSILLVPHVGLFRSNQMGVFTGSAIILVIALVQCSGSGRLGNGNCSALASYGSS